MMMQSCNEHAGNIYFLFFVFSLSLYYTTTAATGMHPFEP